MHRRLFAIRRRARCPKSASALGRGARWAALLAIGSVSQAAEADVGAQLGAHGGVELGGKVAPYLGGDVRLSVPTSPLLLQPTFDYVFDDERTLYHIGANALYELKIHSLLQPYLGVGVSVSSFRLRSHSPNVDDQGNRVGTLLLAGARVALPWVSPFLQVSQRIGEFHSFTVSGGVEVALHERRETADPPPPPRFAVTPYVDNNVIGDVQSGRVGLGVSLAYYPWEQLGFELDAELHGHFFRDEDVASLQPAGVDLDTQAALFSGSLVARHCWQSRAFGAWCPHATAGAGVIHPWFDGVAKMPGSTSFAKAQTDPALSAGIGLTHLFTPHLGLRFDARYFRALVNATSGNAYTTDYGFLRLSAGVSIGF